MISTQHYLYLTYRAEKEKMNEKMKEGEKQEEVDDSGFFSGKIILLSQSVAHTNFLSQLFLFSSSLQVVQSLRWV